MYCILTHHTTFLPPPFLVSQIWNYLVLLSVQSVDLLLTSMTHFPLCNLHLIVCHSIQFPTQSSIHMASFPFFLSIYKALIWVYLTVALQSKVGNDWIIQIHTVTAVIWCGPQNSPEILPWFMSQPTFHLQEMSKENFHFLNFCTFSSGFSYFSWPPRFLFLERN